MEHASSYRTRITMSEVLGEQLFPGTPNEITVEMVFPKLPWNVFRILSSVNSSWREATRTHQLCHARVRAHSAKASIVHIHRRVHNRRLKTEIIGLYSTSDNGCYELPGIPQLGKICVIGGKICRPHIKGERPPLNRLSAEVFVLDVAGQGDWEQCTRMQEPRYQFGCGVVDGKIYVFGGYGKSTIPQSFSITPQNLFSLSGSTVYNESEMYDPKIDAWSLVMPMPSLKAGFQVETIDGELVAYGGYNPNSLFRRQTLYLDVYNPTKNEWRVVKQFSPFGGEEMELRLVARGKFHSLKKDWIDVLIWKNSHGLIGGTQTFPGWRPELRASAYSSVAVNDELSVRVQFEPRGGSIYKGTRLIRGRLSSKNEDITWQETRCNVRSEEYQPPMMCTLLL